MCKHIYYFIKILVIYLFILSLGYNIHQNAIITAYETNFDNFLQEIIDLRSKK